jgi:hypothetical protein
MQEGLVRRLTRLRQHRELIAQAIFQLLHVRSGDGPAAQQVRSPLRDLVLEG